MTAEKLEPNHSVVATMPTRIYQSENINELATALALAQAEMKHAKKDSANPFFKSKYSALPDVFDAARPYLSKHGLSVVQLTDFDNNGEFLLTQLIHKSGQWMRSWYPLRPVRNDPQGLGACVTYAKRYAYGAITGVASTDEDDDGNLASGNNTKEPQIKSCFANASLRNTFCKNVIDSFESAQTIEALDELRKLNKDRFQQMQDSGNEHDALGLEEILKRYKITKGQFQGEV